MCLLWNSKTRLHIHLRKSRDGTMFVCACVRVFGSSQFAFASFYADCPYKCINESVHQQEQHTTTGVQDF